jgi:hypothetical protein
MLTAGYIGLRGIHFAAVMLLLAARSLLVGWRLAICNLLW